jgi:hypothetical protein
MWAVPDQIMGGSGEFIESVFSMRPMDNFVQPAHSLIGSGSTFDPHGGLFSGRRQNQWNRN